MGEVFNDQAAIRDLITERNLMRYRITALLVALAMLLGGAIISTPSQAAAPNGPSARTPVNPKIIKGKAGEGFFDPNAPGYATADSDTTVPSQTMSATAFTPAPYSSLRWATTPEDGGGHPWICISNNIGDAWQDTVIAWDTQADQLSYAYHINGCGAGWGNNEKIDIEVGTDVNRACAYVYKAWNAQSQLTRVIVYHNHMKSDCWWEGDDPFSDQYLRVKHWKSQVIGLGLGNLQYTYPTWPGWDGVMDMTNISWERPRPERGDGLTYDWYN